MPMPSLAGWKSARTTPGVVALNVFSVGDVIQRGDKDPRHRAGAGFPNHRGVNCRQGHQRNQAGHAGRGSSHGLQPAHRPDHPLRRPSRFRPIAWSNRRTIIRTMSVRVDQAELATTQRQALSWHASDRDDSDHPANRSRLHRRPAGDVVQSFRPAEMKRFGAGSS